MELFREMTVKAERIRHLMAEDYRHLHKHPECGLQLPKTVSYVKDRLVGMGYEPKGCAEGITATVGGGERCVLLRADMDGLPVSEKTDLEYRSENGKMHACGHDMHVSMLLGAARLLKEIEKSLNGTVKLCFQPGEETLKGASRMIGSGLLQDPDVSFAAMLHVLTGVEQKTGTIIIPPSGVGASGADFFKVTVKGKGCHGSTPYLGRDPIVPLAHIISALTSLTARELPATSGNVLSVGQVSAGTSANVIPEKAELFGTLRSYGDGEREYLKERLYEISKSIAVAYRCSVCVDFLSGCPSFYNDPYLVKTAKELYPEAYAMPEGTRGGGSEDFSYVSRHVPSIMLCLSAGGREEGYTEPLHSPSARFSENTLPVGAAALAALAVRLLSDTF
ncbi:MAG: amidohydrolase [Clostridia bacterium]|nr:amidohydrolase [Clostridia bacterium]